MTAHELAVVRVEAQRGVLEAFPFLVDAITDLLHWAESAEISWDDAWETAVQQFEDESNG